jgi:cytoskeletal protein CcmA (bactofilin family)
MFHRMKSEAPQPQAQTNPNQGTQPEAAKAASAEQNRPQQQPQQQQKNQNQQNHNQQKQQQQQQKNQNQQSQAQPQAQQSQPSTQQEEAPSMTNQNPNTQTQASEEARSIEIPASPYQRPGQAPVRAGAGYPGGYPAAPAYPGRQPGAPTAGVASTVTAAGDRRLTIGRGIAISGEIESCDHLVVEGTVEAGLKGASVLEIAENGVFYGTVEIDEATVAGRFEGDITVHGRLTIRSTGTITGSLAYKELEVEAGAVVDGRLTPVGSQPAKGQQHNQNKNKNKNHGARDSAANSDDGLFSSKAAAE